jgi:hypothetical protein
MRYRILIAALAAAAGLSGCSTVVAFLPQGMRPVKYDLESCTVMFPQLAGLNVAAGIARENETSLTGVMDYCVTQILGKADYGFEWEFTRPTDPFSSHSQYSLLVWEGKGCLLSEQDKAKGLLIWHRVKELETFVGGGCARLLSAIPPRNISSHKTRAKREVTLTEARTAVARAQGKPN